MSAPLWKAGEIAAAAGARVVGGPALDAAGISIDTRTLSPGDLYVAIEGERHDGHDFVAAAFGAGASGALVSAIRAGGLAGGPLLVADDSLEGLRGLARAARARSNARVVAVTGSVGKTSVKEMLRTALAPQGATHASAASHNNHWGVPLTLARLPREARYAVLEMGMNHAREIAPLSALGRPRVAVITAIAPVHIGNLGSLEAIADAKAEIFEGAERGATAVIDADAPFADKLAAAARANGLSRTLTFGEAGADARLVSVEAHGDGSRVEADVLGRRVAFALGAPGGHMAKNALAVLLAVHALGADIDRAAAALAGFAAPGGRGARLRLSAPGGEFTLIDESYNANPASMRAALALLGGTSPARGGRRVAIVGDMLELGADAERLHAELAPALDAARVDLLLTAGPLSRALHEAGRGGREARHADGAEGLAALALDALRGGDVAMAKGSNGSRVHAVVAALKARASKSGGN
ncbi:MAG: UDP-N-acetylmuramoylalanyl-D-glutamyl-2,6-diaminopimelate--D-alanyl-D-alanine ligase [Hyphomicrobiales bacterium]|nr:UDP-N-acetylmuramoylalanyl-D-glutamyl-2,6-diaminopimelate--D-alanyl-D-alanine ligase [Hyphomicrobiales bacterium]